MAQTVNEAFNKFLKEAVNLDAEQTKKAIGSGFTTFTVGSKAKINL